MSIIGSSESKVFYQMHLGSSKVKCPLCYQIKSYEDLSDMDGDDEHTRYRFNCSCGISFEIIIYHQNN